MPSFTTRRVSPGHSSVDGYTPIWRIFRYDAKCSLTLYKRRKEMYFKTWKKKTSFRRTTNYIYAFSRSFFVSFLSFAKRKKIRARDAHATQFCSWNDFWNLCRYLCYSLLQIPLFYTHDLHICLAFSRTPPFSLLLFTSTRSIYLSTISLLYILPPAIQCFMSFYSMYIALGRPVAKESRRCWPIKKIITRFRETSTSPNFDAPRLRK